MFGALFLGAVSWGSIFIALLRYPIPMAIGLYCGGLALRSGWGPIETFVAGMFACAATHAALVAGLETQNVAVKSSAILITGGASLWVGGQVLEAAHLLLR